MKLVNVAEIQKRFNAVGFDANVTVYEKESSLRFEINLSKDCKTFSNHADGLSNFVDLVEEAYLKFGA